MIEKIVEATKEFNPTVFTEASEEFPTLKEGDCVIDYNEDLALVYEDGVFQISYKDWTGNFEDPIPMLLLILNDNVQDIYLEQLDETILVIKDDGE